MFHIILTIHMLAVALKLVVLFMIPRIKDVEQAKRFIHTYRKIDISADVVLWSTGLGFFFVTTFEYLLQPWMLISMLIYTLIFYAMKKILMRGVQRVAESGKLYAEKEIKELRTQNVCVAIFIVASLAGIGYLMVNKPF